MPSELKHRGFDAAIARREEDYLKRWPVAREIYGIATTGPRDWSVRVGIYGEWGTGKTSVLKLIDAMASKDGHVVIWFDPWEHSTKAELWKAFVLTVFKEIEAQLGTVKGAQAARRKALMDKAKAVVGAITGVVNEHAGKAVEAGLDLVKRHFAFSPEDLESLQGTLGDKRVIVLVDDLDRTAPELVPEILFALKELMNISGFSFIAAFDPLVVGKVLRQYHRGFGDGLKFLEKIIDYPRWLPPPAPGSLAALALADTRRYCDYIPEPELRDAIELLPQNPRAVRQYIRLLALIGPQIQRHNDEELLWSIILAANVIKVRYPRLAHTLLNDANFWQQIERITMLRPDGKEQELKSAFEAHVESVVDTQNVQLSSADKFEIITTMMRLCSKVSLWFGGGAEALAYQMNLAEAPHAVTGKEFDEFIVEWDRAPSPNTVEKWIAEHAVMVDRQKMDVYREVLGSALNRYPHVLRQADTVRREVERPPLIKHAQTLIALIECLVLEQSQIGKPNHQLAADQIEQIIGTFATVLQSSSPTVAEFCTRNEALLNHIIERWQGDPTPLIDAILPYGHWCSGRFDGQKKPNALHQRLSNAVLPKLAAQVIDGLRQSGYVQHVWTHDKGTHHIRCIFLIHDGPLWKDARKKLLVAIQDAACNQAVQENVYDLLYWFEQILDDRANTGDANSLKKLLLEKELLDVLWAAATAGPLSPDAAIHLNKFLLRLKQMGATVNVPAWWDDAIKRSGYKPNPGAKLAAETSEDATDPTV